MCGAVCSPCHLASSEGYWWWSKHPWESTFISCVIWNLVFVYVPLLQPTCPLHLLYSPSSFPTRFSAASMVSWAFSSSTFSLAASIVVFSNLPFSPSTFRSTSLRALLSFSMRDSAFWRFLHKTHPQWVNLHVRLRLLKVTAQDTPPMGSFTCETTFWRFMHKTHPQWVNLHVRLRLLKVPAQDTPPMGPFTCETPPSEGSCIRHTPNGFIYMWDSAFWRFLHKTHPQWVHLHARLHLLEVPA